MNTYAVDFETYYDKECSIKTLGTRGYFNHYDFSAYMVSVVGDEGTSYVGHPKDFNWATLEGQRVLSHNASFDETLYLFGCEKNWWPRVEPAEWHCTADLAAYCGLPRSLKGATSELYDLKVDKSTRDNMKGKRWETMDPEFQAEVSEYALKDSELCLRLWKDLAPKWPEQEQLISKVNRRCAQRGIPIDTKLLVKQKEELAQKVFEAEQCIPWIDRAPTLSRNAFNEECRRNGLEPPHSLALSDEEANEWIRIHGKKYRWIESVRNFRRINALRRKLDSFDFATMADERYYGGIMYFGAHTGRFSGASGNLNLQNLPREEMFGCNLRNLIATTQDKRLIVADLSQIEVRTLCWLANDIDALDEIRASTDIYETFAIRFDLWDASNGPLKEKDPKLRHKVKTMVLGCGYGASSKKFALISNMNEAEAEEAVDLYRTKMHKVVSLWNQTQRGLYPAWYEGSDFTLDLPSGRELNYGRVKSILQDGRKNFVAMVTKGSRKTPISLYGGLLVENLSQALARDVFADILVRLDALGCKTVMHVHDEVVIEANKDDADQTLATVLDTMKTPPAWLPELPLDADGEILKRYKK